MCRNSLLCRSGVASRASIACTGWAAENSYCRPLTEPRTRMGDACRYRRFTEKCCVAIGVAGRLAAGRIVPPFSYRAEGGSVGTANKATVRSGSV